jgi:heat shock protein HtpX
MALAAAGLSTHIWNNNARSVLLLALYPFILGGIVWASAWVYFCLYSYGRTSAEIVPQAIDGANGFLSTYWPSLIAVSAIWFTVAWFAHTKMVRRLSHSHPVDRREEPELYNLLENLCIAQGVAMPRLEIIETHARNAFASGINEASYAVTVTRGLLNSLTREEVEAVLAHELTHIMNRDVRLLIVSVIFTGLFGFAAQMAWSAMRTSIWMPRRRSSGKGGGGLLLILAIMLILWAGYMASLMTRFALSRRREYLADAGAVEMTRSPEAMMRALMRINARDRIPGTTDDIAMMCTQNSRLFLGLFATHPRIDDRIAAISSMTNTPVPELKPVPATMEERFGGSASAKNPWLTRQRRRI